jgi:hypothetical protein
MRLPEPDAYHLVLIASIVFAIGCDQNTTTDEDRISVRDSVGVVVVTVQDWGSFPVPEWQSRVLHSIGSDGGQLELVTVVDAVFLEDSSLVVADQESSELIFLDPGGTEVERVGRRGEGPGEYTQIARVGVAADGNVFVFDGREQRVTLLDRGGNVIGIERVDLQGRYLPYVPLARSRSGEYLAVLETRPQFPPGLHRRPIYLIDVAANGQVVDTIGTWQGKEFYATEDGNHWLPVGFAVTALYSGRGRFAAVGTTDSLDVSVFTADGPVVLLRGSHVPELVPDDQRDAWKGRYLAVWPEVARPVWRDRIEQSMVRGTYPAYGALVIDASGRIWIGEYVGLTEDERRWTVFGVDGRPIGRLSLPVFRPEWIEVENSIPGFLTHELLDATGDRIAILRKDSLDVQYIEVRQLLKSQ